jgi:hypothetical protein
MTARQCADIVAAGIVGHGRSHPVRVSKRAVIRRGGWRCAESPQRRTANPGDSDSAKDVDLRAAVRP